VSRIASTFPLFTKATNWLSENSSIDLFPLRHTLKDYDKQKAKADAKAGLNVALLDFPQAMAYAMIAGLPIQYGICCSAIASIIGPLFASSRFVMLGPTNATAILTLSFFLGLNLGKEESMIALPVLLLLVGVFMTVASLFRVASIVRFVSRSVVTGYITAAACLILVNQVPHLLGYHIPREATLFEILHRCIAFIGHTQWPTVALSATTLVVYCLLKRSLRHIPTIALTLMTMGLVAQGFLHFGFETEFLANASFEKWDWGVGALDFALIGQLGQPALALCVLIMLESASIAKTLAARSGDRINLNQHMFSLGIANTMSSLGSGMAVSGSLTRSMLNFNSGARTPLSSMLSGVLMIIGLFALGPFLGYVPLASLATLIVIVGASLIQWDQIKIMLKSTHADALVFALTFISGLLFQLETAIYLGVGLSIALFLRKASTPHLIEYAFDQEGQLREKPKGHVDAIPEISIVHVEGNLFFGSTEIFLDQTRLICADPNLKVIILRMRNVHHLDASSAMAITDLVRFAREQDRDIIISGALPEAERILRDSGQMAVLGEENFFPHIPRNPNKATRYALKRAQEITGCKEATITLFIAPTEDEQPKEEENKPEETPQP
tara:strand:+ start:1459 stop:3300 length:1842 start_codon:yes stop_codon:yes gene_type:complete